MRGVEVHLGCITALQKSISKEKSVLFEVIGESILIQAQIANVCFDRAQIVLPVGKVIFKMSDHCHHQNRSNDGENG